MGRKESHTTEQVSTGTHINDSQSEDLIRVTYLYYHIQLEFQSKVNTCQDFPGGSMAKTRCSQCCKSGLRLGWGSRSHILQLKIS